MSGCSLDGTDQLHQPRLLCLHGGGSNARIFRIQCRVLQWALRQHVRMVFAEAPFPSPPGPDVTSVYKRFGPYKCWMPTHCDERSLYVAEEIDRALGNAMDEDDKAGGTGQWVGLLGFSQGAKVAAKLLYAQQTLNRPVLFHFGVLLAGRVPLISNAEGGKALPRGARLTLPTLHVHGKLDPGLDHHRVLLHDWCEPDSATLLEWEGGHRVPVKSKDVQAIAEYIVSTKEKLRVLYEHWPAELIRDW